jgi:type VI secretion system protein ImpK
MDLPSTNSSFLLKQFREFYGEVARLRSNLEFKGDSFAATMIIQRPGDKEQAAKSVRQQLLSLLERQALQAGQAGGAFAVEVYKEAQYVMAALADEVFLHMNWDGRDSWALLEEQLFKSHVAGEAIFSRLDRILQRRDPFFLDLAAVYFMALSLGFQGKFRGLDNPHRLEEYRQNLFVFIYRRNPKLFSSPGQLFPQGYQNVLDAGRGKKLPDQKIWLALVAAVVVSWLGISHISWRYLSDDVTCLICQITSKTCSCQVGGQQ